MASDGSRGPKPWCQRQATTIFVRVPNAEWAAVRYGGKCEFRAACGKHSALWNVPTPTPAVAYCVDQIGRYRSSLMVLEDVWREPLGAITPESLEAEGYGTYQDFKRAWIKREHRAFPPLRMTTVYRIRPWRPEDEHAMASELLHRLYGDFF